MKLILASLVFLAFLSMASFYGMAEFVPNNYALSWPQAKQVVWETLADRPPLQTLTLAVLLGKLSYWGAWFSIRWIK